MLNIQDLNKALTVSHGDLVSMLMFVSDDVMRDDVTWILRHLGVGVILYLRCA